MKSGKFLFLAIIFLVSLVCISAVSAADEAVSDVIADTNDETVLEESIDDEGLQASEIDEIEESDDEPVLVKTFVINSQDDLEQLKEKLLKKKENNIQKSPVVVYNYNS